MSNEEKRISAYENKAHRRLLKINYRHMKSNQYVNNKISRQIRTSADNHKKKENVILWTHMSP